MELNTYLERINFRGKPKPNRTTLTALMRAHVLAVPFENLDVQLGVPVTTKPEDAYVKIVERGRGGWCFEQNGLFKWVLSEIGFEVQSLAGYVGRAESQPAHESNHLFLRVDCDEPLFVDVGFGGSLFEPIPLDSCFTEQQPYKLSIVQADGEFFRWTEQSHGASATLDFTCTPVGPNFFDATSKWLQTEPVSPFVRTLTAQRRYEDRHVVLRGLVKRTINADGMNDIVLKSSDQLVACLRDEFDLDVPEIVACWAKLKAQHEEVIER